MLPHYLSTDHPPLVWHLSHFQKSVFTLRSWQPSSYFYSHHVTTSLNTRSSVTSWSSKFSIRIYKQMSEIWKRAFYKITDFVCFLFRQERNLKICILIGMERSSILTLLGSYMKLTSAECTVENSWRAEKLPETCRIS